METITLTRDGEKGGGGGGGGGAGGMEVTGGRPIATLSPPE